MLYGLAVFKLKYLGYNGIVLSQNPESCAMSIIWKLPTKIVFLYLSQDNKLKKKTKPECINYVVV